MHATLKLVVLSFIFASLSIANAADKGAAKAIIVKGKVQALINGKVIPIKRGDWLPEGAQVKTEPRSFTKLLFIDKSTMNVGPDSQMRIDAFPKKEAGIITLVKGQVRSKVTKNYMDMKNKNKSKLFIKTKTAAMGVRGTDFQVSFNAINDSTSLVTFEGAVAMAKLEAGISRGLPTQIALEAMVSSPTAVMVKRGQYSGSSPKMKRATIPIKISPVQLESLDKNAGTGVGVEGETTKSDGPKKKFRNVVPPGMDSKSMANDTSEMDKVMGETVGANMMEQAKTEMAAEAPTADAGPPPEGSIDFATGAIAPTAGGFVDLGTAQYIPPPPGSTFDANAGVYVPPPESGSVDPATGNYTNQHYNLNPDGTFTAKLDPQSGSDGGGRTVASVGGPDKGSATSPKGAAAPPPPPPKVGPMPTMELNLDPDMMQAAMANGTLPPPPPGDAPTPPEADMMELADQTTMDNQEQIQDFQNSDNNLIFGADARTRVNFEFNIQ